jgi:hypothetical protein
MIQRFNGRKLCSRNLVPLLAEYCFVKSVCFIISNKKVVYNGSEGLRKAIIMIYFGIIFQNFLEWTYEIHEEPECKDFNLRHTECEAGILPTPR